MRATNEALRLLAMPKRCPVLRAMPAARGAAYFVGDREENCLRKCRGEFDAIIEGLDQGRGDAVALRSFSDRGTHEIGDRS